MEVLDMPMSKCEGEIEKVVAVNYLRIPYNGKFVYIEPNTVIWRRADGIIIGANGTFSPPCDEFGKVLI